MMFQEPKVGKDGVARGRDGVPVADVSVAYFKHVSGTCRSEGGREGHVTTFPTKKIEPQQP